jgi:hypothetical protein
MKKSLTGMLVLLAGAFAVHGQGAVAFGNYGALNTYLYVSYKGGTKLGGANTGGTGNATDYGLAADIANGNYWSVQLYGAVGSGLASSALSPVAGITATLANGVNDKTAGTWASSLNGSFASAPNGTVATVQVYAWYNEGGTVTSYATALADGLPTGSSAPANVTLGAPPGTPGPLPEGLGNIVVAVPEPSTIALGVMGASAFLMRLRRKV